MRRLLAHFRRRTEWYLVPLFFLALVGWRYREIWRGKVGIGWDLIESYWPDLNFVANAFRRGNFPLWNPYERGGYPAHADPQPALFSPLQWVFTLWASPLQTRPDDREDRAKVAHLPGLDQYRIFDDFLLEQRAGSRLSIREFRGYLISDPLALKDHNAIVSAAIHAPQILAEYNVRYILYGPHSTKGWARKVLSAPPTILAPDRFRRLTPFIFEALHPAPMVAWYGQSRILPAADVLPNLLQARDSAGARQTAFVAAEDLSSDLVAQVAALSRAVGPVPAAVAGKVTRFGTEMVEVEVNAPLAGILVLNEVAYPGWKVLVDGKVATPLRVDLILRGVLVQGGQHRVRWVYEPPYWTPLVALWIAGFLALIVTAIASWRTSSAAPRRDVIPYRAE